MTSSTDTHRNNIVGMIWAQTLDGVIGLDGDLPWYVPEDLKHFKDTTINHPVVMGRLTWESLPEKARPLPNRRNIVLTRNQELISELNEADHDSAGTDSLKEALELARQAPGSEEIWIIGGATLFNELLPETNVLEITFVRGESFAGDTFAPKLGPEWKLSNRRPNAAADAPAGWFTSSSGLEYRIERWEK